MKVNFNTAAMLNAHLAQLHPNDFDFDSTRWTIQNIIPEQVNIDTGAEGGLIYRLFKAGDDQDVFNLNLETPNLVKRFNSYITRVEGYASSAGQEAQKYGFGLVCLKGQEGRVVIGVADEDTSYYDRGIGSEEIESLVRFEDFIRMVRKTRSILDPQYRGIKQLARELVKKNKIEE